MNIIKKLGLSILIIIVALVVQVLLLKANESNGTLLRIVPGAIVIIGLIYVWTKKK